MRNLMAVHFCYCSDDLEHLEMVRYSADSKAIWVICGKCPESVRD